MDRRAFLSLTAALPLVSAAGSASAATLNYKRGLVRKRLAAGETVFLDFYTDWCTTCRAQQRVLKALKAENPTYEEAITFIKVDWDHHSDSDLAQQLKIPRRSTLVALKGNSEIGRIVAGTGKSQIKALLDKALAVA